MWETIFLWERKILWSKQIKKKLEKGTKDNSGGTDDKRKGGGGWGGEGGRRGLVSTEERGEGLLMLLKGDKSM